MLKALVIHDDKGKIDNLGDVVAIARAEGQKLFRTRENVKVIEAVYSSHGYYVVVVSFEGGCSGAAGVSGLKP